MDIWPQDARGKKLCSACGPAQYSDGTPTKFGKWHGRWERKFLPKGEYETGPDGNLRKKSGDG